MEAKTLYSNHAPGKEEQKSNYSRLSRMKLLTLIADLEAEIEFLSTKAIAEIEQLERKLIKQGSHA